MKKNLLSLVILSLLVVNIILTSIMLFSVVGTNKKTAAIVTDIAGILSLETGDADTPGSAEVSMAIPFVICIYLYFDMVVGYNPLYYSIFCLG